MPFTFFHFGPALFFGLLLFSVFSLPVLVVSSVVVDLECVTLYLLLPRYRLHGFFHSFLGGSVAAVVLALLLFPLRSYFDRFVLVLGLPAQQSSFGKIFFSSFFGVYLHVFLDSFLYWDIQPFYPWAANPFLNVANTFVRYEAVYLVCVLLFATGLALYVYRFRGYAKKVAVSGEKMAKT